MTESQRKRILEIGGLTIYEMRGHPKRKPWDQVGRDTQQAYRNRMQELVNALNGAGFDIERAQQQDEEGRPLPQPKGIGYGTRPTTPRPPAQ